MKVCQINAVYGYASTGVIVKNLCDELQNTSHEALPVYQKANPVPKKGFRIGNLIDWKWHALYTRITGKQGYASRMATKKLLAFLNKEKPDVVHLHNLHSNYINIPFLFDFLKAKKIATVITLHDCWFFTGKCTHFVHFGCEKWKESCGNCPERFYEFPSLLLDTSSKVLINKCNLLNSIPNLTIVGCSEWISNLARQSHIGKNRILTIRNGLDTSVFQKTISSFAQQQKLENRFVILGFAGKWGSLNNREGVDRLLHSLDENDRVILVGCNDAYQSHFQRYDKVICLPYISDRRQLADIYNAADVFVNLTHFDNLPTVNMESICCGTPVITFDVGGCKEMIDEDDGIFVQEGDFESVISAIHRLKSNPLKYDVSEKRNKFDEHVCYQQYIDLYQQMILKQ